MNERSDADRVWQYFFNPCLRVLYLLPRTSNRDGIPHPMNLPLFRNFDEISTGELQLPECPFPSLTTFHNMANEPKKRSSFSSAPPPAIEISTPWEIIVRVSSAYGLPRWLLPRSARHPCLPFLSLGSMASPPTGFLILPSFKHACVGVSPPYPALRDTSRLAICTVGNPLSIINTRSLVTGYR